ncbi:MAG: putative sugar nucleotidyl transferase [Gemmatimonadota bacterium]
MTDFYLLEPIAPGPAWAPFAGVRPIAELPAGIWKIRERWEAVLQRDTTALVGDHIEHLSGLLSTPCRGLAAISGPAIVAAAWFAPSGEPITLAPDTVRLAHEGRSVAWLVGAGETWSGPHDHGPAAPIDGVMLHGVFDVITALERFLPEDCADFLADGGDELPAGSIVLGDPAGVICRGALVEPGVVFDVRHGTVVLEEQVEVRHGTRLEGPLYVAAGSRLLGSHIRASVLGPKSSVKGELSTSVLTGYANKSHDGFVGHSVIGHWVNLGAGTTTSNLKNTYGEVNLVVQGTRIETGRQFLGSLIGDHAKTAIGTMLPTGTVIGAGANVFGPGAMPREIPPFAWGSAGEEMQTLDGFLKVAERVMPRRQVAFTPEIRAALSATHRRLAQR